MVTQRIHQQGKDGRRFQHRALRALRWCADKSSPGLAQIAGGGGGDDDDKDDGDGDDDGDDGYDDGGVGDGDDEVLVEMSNLAISRWWPLLYLSLISSKLR